MSDVVLANAGPAEVHCRLRLLAGRSNPASNSGLISLGDLTIEEDTYTARLRGKILELTYKEFELLKFLAQHPSRVFTREQLVTEVWGYDFFGGTRTVDVHVRRLRAKLGSEHESLIGTVRNVGYKMVPPARSSLREEQARVGHRVGTPDGWTGTPPDPVAVLAGLMRPLRRSVSGPCSTECPARSPPDTWMRSRGRPPVSRQRYLAVSDRSELIGVAVAPGHDPAELAVDPGRRRQGIGTGLVTAVLDPLRGLGSRRPAGGPGTGRVPWVCADP